ncbi:hypothetical protein TRICI_001476 [Trichomonascus ciferrii]|uniref:Uncharacterized protein n=1 Tax=Trichomonascus ciferrii TaxID=44093 RepID=A0A642V9X8_9ASCO|nr:hypothetical protein TRICI_001476 [Trichomonascus ciferrii]
MVDRKVLMAAPNFLGEDKSLTPDQKALKRFSVAGKNVVITGGAGGLGLDSAYALLEHGAEGVLLLDLNVKQLEETRRTVRELYPDRTIEVKQVDVTNYKQVLKSVEYASKVLKSIDIVLPFAGVSGGEGDGDAPDRVETWQQIMDINTTGVFYVTKSFGDYMVKQGKGGSIIMTASLAGHSFCVPCPIAYGASKSAVLSMRTNFAKLYGRAGIRVNSISPGFFKSPMTEELSGGILEKDFQRKSTTGRFGQRGEISGIVVLLASGAGSFISGADLVIDGGYSAKL